MWNLGTDGFLGFYGFGGVGFLEDERPVAKAV